MKTEDFWTRFDRLCREAKLPDTNHGRGAALGVSGPFISMVKHQGKIPSMENAIAWSETLKCSVEYLLKGKESAGGLSSEAIEFGRLYDECPPDERGTLVQNARLVVQAAKANLKEDISPISEPEEA